MDYHQYVRVEAQSFPVSEQKSKQAESPISLTGVKNNSACGDGWLPSHHDATTTRCDCDVLITLVCVDSSRGTHFSLLCIPVRVQVLRIFVVLSTDPASFFYH